MPELAGKLNQVFALAGATAMTGSTGAKVFGVNSSTYSQLCDLLDIPQFGDTYKNRMGGLKDTTISLSGNYDPTDATGQNIFIPGDYCFVGIYPQGTGVAGKQVKCIVESFEISADVTGTQSFSVSLSGVVAPVALPLRP